MAGAWAAGLREIWAHPVCVVHDASVRIAGRAPEVSAAVRSPCLIERKVAAGGGTATERWTAAVAHAACVWDIEAAPDAEIDATWRAGFREPGGESAAAAVEQVDGGIRLTSTGGPLVEVILARGTSLTAAGPVLTARGRGALRLVIITGTDAADLARARDRIAKRGLAAIAGERAQHARLVADFGCAIESPEPADIAAFEWAKTDADALLVELPGGARRLAAAYRVPGSADWDAAGPIVWGSGAELASLGAALMAAGLREPVRDTLRSAAAHGAADPVGFASLAAAWHGWSGEPPEGGAVLEPGAMPRRDASNWPPGAVWAPILRELHGRWGAVPAAGAALALTPAPGADRAAMAVRRLRVGQSVVDAEARRRFDRMSVRLQRRHGPALPVSVELAGPPPIAVSADDEPLPGKRAVVAVSDRHEVLFQF